MTGIAPQTPDSGRSLVWRVVTTPITDPAPGVQLRRRSTVGAAARRCVRWADWRSRWRFDPLAASARLNERSTLADRESARQR